MERGKSFDKAQRRESERQGNMKRKKGEDREEGEWQGAEGREKKGRRKSGRELRGGRREGGGRVAGS